MFEQKDFYRHFSRLLLCLGEWHTALDFFAKFFDIDDVLFLFSNEKPKAWLESRADVLITKQKVSLLVSSSTELLEFRGDNLDPEENDALQTASDEWELGPSQGKLETPSHSSRRAQVIRAEYERLSSLMAVARSVHGLLMLSSWIDCLEKQVPSTPSQASAWRKALQQTKNGTNPKDIVQQFEKYELIYELAVATKAVSLIRTNDDRLIGKNDNEIEFDEIFFEDEEIDDKGKQDRTEFWNTVEEIDKIDAMEAKRLYAEHKFFKS